MKYWAACCGCLFVCLFVPKCFHCLAGLRLLTGDKVELAARLDDQIPAQPPPPPCTHRRSHRSGEKYTHATNVVLHFSAHVIWGCTRPDPSSASAAQSPAHTVEATLVSLQAHSTQSGQKCTNVTNVVFHFSAHCNLRMHMRRPSVVAHTLHFHAVKVTFGKPIRPPSLNVEGIFGGSLFSLCNNCCYHGLFASVSSYSQSTTEDISSI